ncbi:uncharacterized protein LOC133178745 [Saccostrea echinata]|uniref:uncharacterized protein LOC133178745 n=1 Tax=Saccostrea echinata TaxID=191078 RepID=UPI002A82F2D1|nr:uncharacterized protein LOC133178745 [Saccostrea echinata]XP_061169435.1 uncharacterized protein LOC133178745 [Saccostrea echinata]
MASVTTQQPQATDTNSVVLKSGPVTVRHLKNSEDDFKFFAKVLVEAFEGKFVYATSKGSLPDMEQFMINRLRGRPPEYYERNFVAEYEGERAGACVLIYHGDSEIFPEREEDMPPLGCTDICGLVCMDCALGGEKVPPGKCYLDTIGVDAKFRGKGIGKVMLDVADADAKRRGCKAIYLKVASNNRAKHLYERHGYVVKYKTSRCCCMWCQTGIKEFTTVEKSLE